MIDQIRNEMVQESTSNLRLQVKTNGDIIDNMTETADIKRIIPRSLLDDVYMMYFVVSGHFTFHFSLHLNDKTLCPVWPDHIFYSAYLFYSMTSSFNQCQYCLRLSRAAMHQTSMTAIDSSP